MEVKFHRLPSVNRENIILPEGLLKRIERQTVRFSELSEKLLSMSRHLKRGILLHGPPGTGKTLTAMYLAQAIRDRTVLLLTGPGHGMIEQSCALARTLQPSIVVLEDVDLVAEERTRPGAACAAPLLFELLNQMDGLADESSDSIQDRHLDEAIHELVVVGGTLTQSLLGFTLPDNAEYRDS